MIYFFIIFLPTILFSENLKISYYIQTGKNLNNQDIMENEQHLFQTNANILYKAILPNKTLWISNLPESKLFEKSPKIIKIQNNNKNFYRINNPSLTTLITLSSLSLDEEEIPLISWININAFYYGALLLLILYTIFFNHLFQHKSFVIYQYFHIVSMLLLADSDGWLQKVIWPEHSQLSITTIPVFMILSTILLLLFSRILLRTKENRKSLDIILILLLILNILSILLIFFIPASKVLWIVTFLELVTITITLYATIYILIFGETQKYFTVAWMVLLIAMIIEYARYMGFVTTNYYTFFLLKITLFVELITISMMTIIQRLTQLQKETERVENLIKENEHELSQKKFDAKRLQQKHDLLNKLAGTDGLTGLYNRREFFNISESLIFKAKNQFESYSFMMLDLDHFKNVNDTYGHDVGDIVLKSVTKKLTEAKRSDDVFGRIGGEEFAILLPNTSLEEAEELANNFCKIISKLPIDIGEKNLFVTMSVGVASDPNRTSTLSELMKSSDVALYEAKRSGRNRVVSLDCTK